MPRRYRATQLPGFSIAEVLIASAVITVGILATLNLLYSSRNTERGNRDFIVAAQLAQEGVEIVRNVRDNNFASGGGGYVDISSATNTGSQPHCTVDLGGATYATGARLYDCRNTIAALAGALSATSVTLNGIVYTRYVNVNYVAATPGAEAVAFVYWGGLWSPSNNVTTMKATCNRQSKCAYSEANLLGWK